MLFAVTGLFLVLQLLVGVFKTQTLRHHPALRFFGGLITFISVVLLLILALCVASLFIDGLLPEPWATIVLSAAQEKFYFIF